MRYKINYDGKYQDSLIVEGETLEEIRESALAESSSRGWELENCYSEKLD